MLLKNMKIVLQKLMNVKIRIFHLFGMFGGGENKQLSNMKDRFNKINSKKHFYFDPKTTSILHSR